METLIKQLNSLCDSQPFQTGWHLKNLRTGETCERNGDVVVPSASTRKISILMAALQAVNEGKVALDQPITIQAKYQDNKSGTFQHFQPGFTIQFRDVLVMMIIVSDNTCTGTVVDMLGLDQINAYCRSIGMKGTTHRYGIPPRISRDHPLDAVTTTTPADTGLLLDLIIQGAKDPNAAARLGCTPSLCQLGVDILSWQKLNWRLPALLPMGTIVAHKTGTGQEWRNNNDAGVIFQNDQPLFILSVYTEHVPLEMPDGMPGYTIAGQHIARLCRVCYDALKV
ncbi:MAG: serine hydrolase [Deltaproteobacteria bacterium]|nr:serine hydrolase [Deltaproteobacteria bacterium]MBW2305561.1 serine hydrolase [Deltaproteobacteria bacterium]